MTTEPKAEGGEAVAWLTRWNIGAKSVGLYPCGPDEGTSVPLYLHPTPSAVEALARAAKEARSGYAWHAGLHLGGTDRLDSEALARIDAALAHPEIAALLKETK